MELQTIRVIQRKPRGGNDTGELHGWIGANGNARAKTCLYLQAVGACGTRVRHEHRGSAVGKLA